MTTNPNFASLAPWRDKNPNRPKIISRKGAKDAKPEKSEARNPKQIQNDEKQNNHDAQKERFKGSVLNFLDLKFIQLRFVSDFDIRISDFISKYGWFI